MPAEKAVTEATSHREKIINDAVQDNLSCLSEDSTSMFDELTKRDENSPFLRAATMRKQKARFSDLRDAFYGTDETGTWRKSKTAAIKDSVVPVSRPTLINEDNEERKSDD